jgi:hypothetical protein
MILRSIVIAAGVFGVAAVAHAAEISEGCCEPYRYVYAEFWYGDRKVVAPVRHGPIGDEVMLPGEIWVPCQFSCEYTLRKQTLHYLESQGAGSGSEFAPTYPRADSYVDGWGQRNGYLF